MTIISEVTATAPNAAATAAVVRMLESRPPNSALAGWRTRMERVIEMADETNHACT